MSARIMVVDNDKGMRELFDLCLTREGWEISISDYTQITLAAVQQYQPTLIILDINLVHSDAGWEFLQLLKMEEATAGIPLLVCTTEMKLSPEIEGYLAGRHIQTVRKPFELDPFIRIVQQLLNSTNTLVVPLALNTALPILVVEDNEPLSENLSTLLYLEGYKVVTAANGLLALEAVTHAQHRLILLDITMPVMNGIEFLTAYAQLPNPHSPVIILSAVTDYLDIVLPPFVIQTIPKPYDVLQLLSALSKYTQPV